MYLIPEISFDFIGIVFLVFCAALFIQILYLLIFYVRLLLYKPKPVEDVSFPVTIIVCARNEEDNLFHYLPKILEQDYPEFEVIVVND